MTGDSLGDKAHKVDTSGGTYVEIGEYHVHGASPPIPEPTLMGSDFSERGRILLLIKGDVQSFDRNALVSTLGWMLGVDQERIEIINIRPSNSFLVELEMPLEAAERLYLAIEVEPRVRSVQAPHLRASKGKLDLDEMPQEKREAIEAKLRIGASMILSVDYDTAVLTTLDGKPKGVYMIGQHTLPPHEQILAVIDLRPQRAIQTDVVALTRDGIYVTSDLEIAYTIKHSDTPSIDNPYPVDQMVLHGIVYRLPVFDSENSPLQAYIMLFAVDQFRNVIAHYRFTELYEQSTEDTVLRTLICDEIKERLLPMGEELGIEINSVRLGLLKVPEQRVREQMIADWARLRDLEIRLRVAPDTASLRAQELTTILKTVLELIYSENGKSISDIIPQVRELHDLTVSLADLMSAAQYALSSGAEDIGKGASIPEPGELWSREWVEQQRKRAREILQEIQEWAARRPSNPPEFEDDVDFMD